MATPTIVTACGPEYSLAADAALIVMQDGSARVLGMGDCFYALPPIGAMMLQKTLQLGSAAAVRQVAAEYGVDPARVQADLQRLLAPLEERGILQRQGCEERRRFASLAGLTALLLRLVMVIPSQRVRAAALLSLARLSLLLCGWTGTMAAWKRQVARQPLRPAALPADTFRAKTQAIDDVVCSAASWNLLGVACKERALCCWALARAAGLPAALVIGVELFPLSGHCWCEAGPWIVSDHPENCARYTPVLRFQ